MVLYNYYGIVAVAAILVVSVFEHQFRYVYVCWQRDIMLLRVGVVNRIAVLLGKTGTLFRQSIKKCREWGPYPEIETERVIRYDTCVRKCVSKGTREH